MTTWEDDLSLEASLMCGLAQSAAGETVDLGDFSKYLDDDERPGVTFTRGQVEAWVGQALTDEQVADIEECAAESSIPNAIEMIAHEALGIECIEVYHLANEGTIGGVHYVTVLDFGGNPMEYNIPIEDAVARYFPEEV